MKLIIDENIVIFLDKIYLNNFNLNDRRLIEKKLIKLVNKIQNKYPIDLNGYYNVYIYKDQYYGIIVDMQKEEIEYFDYFGNQIELNIEIIEDIFLYQIEDIFNLNKQLLKKFTIYKSGEKIYLKAKENLSSIELGTILENAQIIYGKKSKNIIKKSKIIEM